MMRKYHWLRDLPDQRDYHVSTSNKFKLIPISKIPTSIDLRPWCSKIENQGDLGSCTGHAMVGAMEYLENKSKIGTKKGEFVDLSRLFVYFNERVLEHSVKVDAGAYIRDGIKALKRWGVCAERLWPYKIRKFDKKPPKICYKNGLKRVISAYARVGQDILEIKQVLASGYPIIFGFAVYESFESDVVTDTGVVPMPEPDEWLLGGHAVLCVGYDDETGRVLVRNSWGRIWGDNGYFTMPYDYICSPDLSDDLWSITK